MENTLLIGLSRQVALARELDVIANNMANVNTNGFKARSSRFEEFLEPDASAETFPWPDRKLSFVIDAGSPIDLSDGATEPTGNPLDVAIRGDAFFVVETPAGERYTRNGAFQVDPQGRLVTSDGFPVVGDGGAIQLEPGDTGIVVAGDGTISTDAGQRGRLALVRFDAPQMLSNMGANLFAAVEPAQQAQPAGERARVEQGFIERSNVRAVYEMTRLMEVSRAYTRVASTLSSLTDLQRTAIRTLGEAA
ncbi:flagellar basal-body rod protein FlgF [Salinarimonas rosea]|uniref:flagellar basal-body rod protein FlgF n=1 Tax=Salinarimonas rosea TaxID=552063 RepID=UPI000429FA5C|nr:flagellar basal-body rod protein FlgF [Salinarimonas rosea]